MTHQVQWSRSDQAMTAYINVESGLAQADLTRMQPNEVAAYFVDQRGIYRLVRAAPVFLLNRLIVPPRFRLGGLGTQLVEATVLEAEKLKANILVEARAYTRAPGELGLSQTQLVAFYIRHRFRMIQDHQTFTYLVYIHKEAK